MPLADADRDFLKQIFQRLKDEPLRPGDPLYHELYEPIYQQPGCYDPIAKIKTHIEWSQIESLKFFSGFSGSGKTTELYRLKATLEQANCAVLLANYEDYLALGEPIDISELLLVIAGAFADRIKEDLKHLSLDLTSDTIWSRLFNYLTTTEVELTEIGLKGPLDLKANLKSTPTFRQRVKKALENRTAQLKNQVDDAIQEGVREIRLRLGPDTPIVFLFDSFEKIRGPLQEEANVRHSLVTLFTIHSQLLRFPNVHMVYAVPPWLKFAGVAQQLIEILPSIRLEDQQGNRDENGWSAMRRVLVRRLRNEPDCNRLFGPPTVLDSLIADSGGDLRTLFNLVREIILRASQSDQLPVSAHIIQEARTAIKSQFLPIAIMDAHRLARIARTKTNVLENGDGQEQEWLTRLLDTHRVLFLRNGGEWYDIHPLIRDEVKAMVDRDDAVTDSPS